MFPPSHFPAHRIPIGIFPPIRPIIFCILPNFFIIGCICPNLFIRVLTSATFTNAPALVGTQWTVTNTFSSSAQFYRLRKQ